MELSHCDIVFPSDGGEDYFEIKSNADWTITYDAKWLEIKQKSGCDNSVVELKAIANELYDDRNCTVTIKAGEKIETFTITQKAVDAIIVTKDKFDIPQKGGDLMIEVQTNIAYEITINSNCQSWIREAPNSKALANYIHKFIVEENPETTNREGAIIVTGNDGRQETVNIYQAQMDELVLIQTQYYVPARGGQVTVELRSNVDYEVIIPDDVDWIKQLPSERADRLLLEVTPNSKVENREAELIVKDKNSNLSQKFTINQTVGTILIDKTEYEVPAKESVLNISLNTDIDFDVIIPDSIDWISVVKTKTLDNKTFSLAIKANSEIEQRIAEVVIKDINSDLKEILVIKQIAGTLLISKDYYMISCEGGLITFDLYTDIDFEILIPENINWISTIETKALQRYYVTLSVDKHESEEERTAEIVIKDINSPISQVITINQKSIYYYIGDLNVSSENGLVEIKESGYTVIDGNVSFSKLGTLALLDNQIKEIKGSLSIKEVSNLNGLGNLTNIGGSFTIEDSEITDFCGLESLQRIGGSFNLYGKGNFTRYYDGSSFSKLVSFNGLNQLSEIGGDFTIKAYGNEVTSFNSLESFRGLENLHTINGDFIIYASSETATDRYGNYVGYALHSLADFEGLNNLNKIGGNFEITAYSGYNSYTTGKESSYSLATLNSFKGLENLYNIGGNVNIAAKYHERYGYYWPQFKFNLCRLSDFSALKIAAKNMSGTWSVSGCSYNPTKEQVANGEGKKPQE